MSVRVEVSSETLELHQRAVVVDTHVDSILSVISGERRLTERSDSGHLDFPRMREGGVDVQFFACYIAEEFKPDRSLKRVLQLIDAFYREVESASGEIAVCTGAAEIDAALAAGKMAAILSVEGGEAIGADLACLRMLYRLGVRSLGLTWNQRNAIADGIGEARTRGGLTKFGVEVVREMNRIGMLVDVSHLSEPGFWDVLAVSQKPVIASHSNARAVCDHLRNLTDDQIRALARNGGVMGMNFAPRVIDPQVATVERLLDHVDHVAGLVGADHIGLGSDYDGIAKTPAGLEDVTCLPKITEGLLRRGYSEEDILKILGLNHLRVIREVLS